MFFFIHLTTHWKWVKCIHFERKIKSQKFQIFILPFYFKVMEIIKSMWSIHCELVFGLVIRRICSSTLNRWLVLIKLIVIFSCRIHLRWMWYIRSCDARTLRAVFCFSFFKINQWNCLWCFRGGERCPYVNQWNKSE